MQQLVGRRRPCQESLSWTMWLGQVMMLRPGITLFLNLGSESLFKNLKTRYSIIFAIKKSVKIRSKENWLHFLPHNIGEKSFSCKKWMKKNYPSWEVYVFGPKSVSWRHPLLSHFWYLNIIKYAIWVIYFFLLSNFPYVHILPMRWNSYKAKWY